MEDWKNGKGSPSAFGLMFGSTEDDKATLREWWRNENITLDGTNKKKTLREYFSEK